MKTLRTTVTSFLSDRSGVSGLEFTFVAPFFIILIFGAVTIFDLVRTASMGEKATFVVADILSRKASVDDAFLKRMNATFDHISGQKAAGFRVTSAKYDGSTWSVLWSWGSGDLKSRTVHEVPSQMLPIVAKNDSLILVEVDYVKLPMSNVLKAVRSAQSHTAVERPRFVSEIAKE